MWHEAVHIVVAIEFYGSVHTRIGVARCQCAQTIFARLHIVECLLHKVFRTAEDIAVAVCPGVKQVVAHSTLGQVFVLVLLGTDIGVPVRMSSCPSVKGSRFERGVRDEVGQVAYVARFALKVEFKVVEACPRAPRPYAAAQAYGHVAACQVVDGEIVPVFAVVEVGVSLVHTAWQPVVFAADGVLLATDGIGGLCIASNQCQRHLFPVGIQVPLRLLQCAVEIVGQSLLARIQASLVALHAQHVCTLRHIGHSLMDIIALGVELGIAKGLESGFGAFPSLCVVAGEGGIDEQWCYVQLVALGQGDVIEEGTACSAQCDNGTEYLFF